MGFVSPVMWTESTENRFCCSGARGLEPFERALHVFWRVENEKPPLQKLLVSQIKLESFLLQGESWLLSFLYHGTQKIVNPKSWLLLSAGGCAPWRRPATPSYKTCIALWMNDSDHWSCQMKNTGYSLWTFILVSEARVAELVRVAMFT